MQIEYRPARSADVDALLKIKQSVWPEEETSLAQISQALAEPGRICTVAEATGQVVGFMDCFTTHDMQNKLRLEMDLLAVRPDFQGNGIASMMIAHCLRRAEPLSYAFARSLIQISNIASQHAFQHNGFIAQEQTLNLYVIGADHANIQSDTGLCGTPVWVNTFGYTGYWLEAPLSTGKPHLSRPFQTCGALIPQDSPWESLAQQTGYEFIHPYQWWIRPGIS